MTETEKKRSKERFTSIGRNRYTIFKIEIKFAVSIPCKWLMLQTPFLTYTNPNQIIDFYLTQWACRIQIFTKISSRAIYFTAFHLALLLSFTFRKVHDMWSHQRCSHSHSSPNKNDFLLLKRKIIWNILISEMIYKLYISSIRLFDFIITDWTISSLQLMYQFWKTYYYSCKLDKKMRYSRLETPWRNFTAIQSFILSSTN